MSHPSVDVLSEAFRADPDRVFASLRESRPVAWADPPGLWLITRYDDVVEILKRPEDFSSVAMRRQQPGEADPHRPGVQNVITTDPPEHTRLRAVMQRRFTNRALAALQPRIDELAGDLVERIGNRERFELVDELAIPLPVTVIAELLGVPATQREDFKRWSDCLVRVLNERQGPAWERARTGVFELVAYFRECLDARRPHASDEGDGGDLIDVLLAAERRGELQAREMVPYCTLLLGAGNETTTNLIGGMTIALLDNPDQLALLQERPELLPQAVEEALRFCSPVQALYRRATRDLEIQDVHIAAGQDLALCYGSANRDPRKFEEPDRFDILRDTAGHLGFGYGIHHCLGAHLARREARAVFKQLLPLLPKLTRVDEQVHWAPSWVVRGPDRLPLQRVA